jgi:benzoate/toluate 1,2-dioxygenase beta subunit/2,4,5-trichlorophenoxyacetic acid oxygenase 2
MPEEMATTATLRAVPGLQAAVEELLFVEALYLDRKEWAAWVEMYEPHAEYWAPSWLGEDEVGSDPNSQVSFIYHTSRAQLQERIARIQSRKSITALPLPRTLHMISNVMVSEGDGRTLNVRSCWTAHVYDPRTYKQHLHFGTYEHRLAKVDGNFRIARKKIVIMNDRIPAVLDFYSI